MHIFFCFWVSEQQKTWKNQPSGVEATDPYSKICKEKIKIEKNEEQVLSMIEVQFWL